MATPMAWSDFGRKLFYSQLFERIPVPTSNFAGQTVLITGSNSGLGREAARHILRLGAFKVILAVRNLTKGEAAAEDLLKSTGVTRASVEVWELDLSDHDSVKKLSRRANKLERLDAVILNAGMLTQQWTVVDGMEAQIVVNVINTILLGLLLLPKLRSSAKTHHVRGRMTFVTSDAHYVAQVKEANASGSLFDALSNPELAVMEDRYSTSKLFLLYAIREVAARSPVTRESNVTISAVTPGMCHSNLFRDDKPWLHALIERFVFLILARPAATGGAVMVDAVRSDVPIEAHGAFLMDCKVADNGPNVDSKSGQVLSKRFNAELFDKLATIEPGIMSVLN